jgi:DNA-binding MarR family transcriptional regulator
VDRRSAESHDAKLLENFESRIRVRPEIEAVLGARLVESAPNTQIELGRMLWIDRTSMTAMIDDLEARDYVRRERHPDDRRAYLVSLTRTASKRLRARVVADETEAEVLAPIERRTRRSGRYCRSWFEPSGLFL